MTDIYLPAMRHLVALRLRSEGLSQTKISSTLGVTQASVSLYLSAGPERAYGQLSRLSLTKPQAERDAAVLAAALEKGAAFAVGTLNRLWLGLLGGGSACPAHKAMYPGLADCDFCVKEYGGTRGSLSKVISEVAEAAALLEASSEFIGVMPEVSVNIACAIPAPLPPATSWRSRGGSYGSGGGPGPCSPRRRGRPPTCPRCSSSR